MKGTLVRLAVGVLLALSPVTWMAAPAVAEKPLISAPQGLAIRGYDPVAYFTDGKPVEGRADFAWEWKGATWRFANAKHREMFAADPEKYAPQYGGYCAFGVAKGLLPDSDPMQWRIVGGKLYLNSSARANELWIQDIPGYVRSADQNWPNLPKN